MDIFEKLSEQFDFDDVDANQYSPLVLAFIGDVVYDLIIRTKIVLKGNKQVNKIHKDVREYVKAESQAHRIRLIEPYLTENEVAVYKRGRNAKSGSVPKNAKLIDYKMATGFEALIGYLFLKKEYERLMELSVSDAFVAIEDSASMNDEASENVQQEQHGYYLKEQHNDKANPEVY